MSRNRWRLPAVLLASALLPARAPAQGSAPQPPTFRSRIELVEVAVLVRDGSGRFVPDLEQEDFEVVEQGLRLELVAFHRVALPIVRTAPMADAAALPVRAVASDVSSNERVADSRVYVLLLDALHVDSRRQHEVRRFARQFVLESVGPADLAAVVTPGGIEAATQDFTSDKARLLAAIDRFTGSKVASATVGIEDERRALERGSAAIHDGKDPDDGERMRRAVALTDVLQAFARHLGRVERRRKAMLLFSEGIDYNQADVMGLQQRHSTEVTRGLGRAIGALMRANVSLYAIDPRGLSSAEGGLTEIQGSTIPRGQQPGLAGSVDQEYSDSLRSLHHVSESTGGFATTDSNSMSAAFQRIVDESSNYYVLGYSPAKPMRPGEFREIGVRVKKPGLRVVARKGHQAPAAAAPVASLAAPPEAPGVAVTPFGAGRPRGRPEPLVEMSAPVATRGRRAGDLQLLLASPLPQAGLPMRVQAIPFRGDAKRGSLELVVEVLGQALQFTERAGRFEERIELAMLTVDGRGKADNGRSTTIELRLTPEELQRAKATGVRWLSRLDVAPGRYQVRVAGRATRGSATGLVTADVEVEKPVADRPALSGVTLTSMTSVVMLTKGEARPSTAISTPPSAARTFVIGDRLTAAVEVYVPAASAELELVAYVEWPDGSRIPPLRKKIAGGQSRREEVAIPVDTSLLAPGPYVLRIAVATAAGNADKVERDVPFEVTAAAAR